MKHYNNYSDDNCKCYSCSLLFTFLTVTERKDDDTVILKCSVSTYKECKHTVKRLYDGNKDLRMSQSTCSASVTFTTSDHICTSKNSELLKCQVTHGGNVQESIFSQSSGQERDK